MKGVNSGPISQAFVEVGGSAFIARRRRGLRRERPKPARGSGQGRRCAAWQFGCLSRVRIGLKVFLLYPSGCSSEETFLLPKYTRRPGLKGLKPTTKFLPPSHHH